MIIHVGNDYSCAKRQQQKLAQDTRRRREWIKKSKRSQLHGGSGEPNNMEADIFSKPAKLSFEGDVAENSRRFKQQLEIYMSATGLDAESVPKKKKVAIILNLAGEEAIKVHNSFTFTEAERNDPAALLAKFQQHCEPKKNITCERHVFNTRSQQPAQPFDAFLTERRLQAKKCAYGTLTDELIRDRLVDGITWCTVFVSSLIDCISICDVSAACAISMHVCKVKPAAYFVIPYSNHMVSGVGLITTTGG